MPTDKTERKEFVAQIEDLRLRLQEAENVLHAIRSGDSLDAKNGERLARSILYQAGEGIVVCNVEGLIVRASRVAVMHCGRDLMRRPFDQVLPLRLAGSDRPFSVAAPLRGERFENVEATLDRSDGRTCHLVLNATPLTDRNGAIVGCVVTLTDVTARREAEHELRRSEEQFRTIADMMPAFVWTTTPDGTIDYVNRQFLDYTGSPPEVGAEGYSFPVHPDDRQATDTVYREAIESGETYQIEHRLKRYDGVYRWYLCRSQPLRNGSGRIVKWYGTSTDIHDLRETQEKLQESEAKFRWLFDSNLISTIFWNNAGEVTEANEAFCNLVGCTADEISSGGLKLQSVTPPELMARDYAAWAEIRDHGSCQPYEKELINRTDGHRVPVLITGALLAGSSTNGIGFAIDLSERKRVEEELRLATEELEKRVKARTAELLDTVAALQQEAAERMAAEESLRESEALLKTVLDTLPVAVWVLDKEAHVVAVNPAGRRLWAGDSPRPDQPEVYRGWHHNTGKPILDGEWGGKKAVFYGDITLGQEYDIQCFDGSRKVILYSAVPLTDKTGSVIGAVVVNEDITERIQWEQALQTEVTERLRAVEELRAKEGLLMQQSRLAAMGEMIGNIAHQWRQPLNTLGLIVQGLPLHYETGEFTKEYLDGSITKAMQVITHMSRTIDDFRNFFRPDKAKVPFRVNEVVEKTVSLVDASFRELQLAIEVAAEAELVVEGYPNEFSQVLLNILMNARDAFLEGGVAEPRVMIRLFRKEGAAVVTVSDNAGGIAAEVIDRIFDPYYTTKGPDKGTGIGLFMAKTIVEKNMNGRLTVRNTGEGAEFTITISGSASP